MYDNCSKYYSHSSTRSRERPATNDCRFDCRWCCCWRVSWSMMPLCVFGLVLVRTHFTRWMIFLCVGPPSYMLVATKYRKPRRDGGTTAACSMWITGPVHVCTSFCLFVLSVSLDSWRRASCCGGPPTAQLCASAPLCRGGGQPVGNTRTVWL